MILNFICLIPILFLGGFIMFFVVVVVVIRQLYLVCFHFCFYFYCTAPCNMLLKGTT